MATDKWEFYKDSQGNWRWSALPRTEILLELRHRVPSIEPIAREMRVEMAGMGNLQVLSPLPTLGKIRVRSQQSTDDAKC